MRHRITAAALVALAFGAAPLSAQDVDVQGAWVLQSMTDTAGTETESQPGLFVFTGTHYSMMYVPGSEPRAEVSSDTPLTDAEKVVAYNSFIANTGRYEVDGDQLTFRAFVAKFPPYMAAWPDNAGTVTVHLAGDILHWTFQNGFMFTLRRVEGEPPPWSE
jgi:hypothetical protein